MLHWQWPLGVHRAQTMAIGEIMRSANCADQTLSVARDRAFGSEVLIAVRERVFAVEARAAREGARMQHTRTKCLSVLAPFSPCPL